MSGSYVQKHTKRITEYLPQIVRDSLAMFPVPAPPVPPPLGGPPVLPGVGAALRARVPPHTALLCWSVCKQTIVITKSGGHDKPGPAYIAPAVRNTVQYHFLAARAASSSSCCFSSSFLFFTLRNHSCLSSCRRSNCSNNAWTMPALSQGS